VIARKPGRSSRRVVLTAHIDSKDNTPGAVDNATGVAILLLLTELLQEFVGDIGIEIVAINGEDYYSAIGEVKYLEFNKNDMDEILLNINMDGVGYRDGGTAYSFYECNDDVKEMVNDVFSAFEDIEEGEIWHSGDHMIFVQSGTPAVAITSEHGMTGLAQISHTPKDRPELVDPSKLVTTALALRDLLLKLNRLYGR
jgi:aminopeptidase YwaD